MLFYNRKMSESDKVYFLLLQCNHKILFVSKNISKNGFSLPFDDTLNSFDIRRYESALNNIIAKYALENMFKTNKVNQIKYTKFSNHHIFILTVQKILYC